MDSFIRCRKCTLIDSNLIRDIFNIFRLRTIYLRYTNDMIGLQVKGYRDFFYLMKFDGMSADEGVGRHWRETMG